MLANSKKFKKKIKANIKLYKSELYPMAHGEKRHRRKKTKRQRQRKRKRRKK